MGAAEQNFVFDSSQALARRLTGVYGWVFGGPGSIDPSNQQRVACPRWVGYPPVRHMLQMITKKIKSSCDALPKTSSQAAELLERCRRIQTLMKMSIAKDYMEQGVRLEVAPPSHMWYTAFVSHAWHLAPSSHAWPL